MSDDVMKWLGRLDEKMDRVIETLARQSAVLEEHQRRSLANESAVDLLRQEMQPLKTHVAMWAGAGKVLAIATAIAGLVAAVLKMV